MNTSVTMTQISATAMLISLLITVLSMSQDLRRFRNGLYLLGTMILTVVWLLFRNAGTRYDELTTLLILSFIGFLVFIVPILLIINGFAMIKREGFSFRNLLSLAFGVVIFLGEFAMFRGMFRLAEDGHSLRTIYLLFGHTVFYASMVFLAFMFYTFLIRVIPRRDDFDYIVVLGCGLLGGEKVSKLLSDRLDKAVKIYNRTDSDCRIIVSGGQGADEKISEAEAMKGYLLMQGIHEQDIIKEDQSKDTMENLRNSQAIIQKRGGRQYTAVTTSGYHVFRAMIYARRLSFDVTGIGAHTALYYWPSAMIREYVALIVHYFIPYGVGWLSTFALLYLFVQHL